MSSGPALPRQGLEEAVCGGALGQPIASAEPPTAHLHFWWDRSQASKMDGKPKWKWYSLGPEDLD